MRDKIATKHNVAEYEVQEAFQAPARLDKAVWDWSEEHRCWRLLVVGTTYAGRTVEGSLYPVVSDPETWWLGTAWPAI